jgi:chitodextrinase
MKKLVGLAVLIACTGMCSFAQVDTTFIYNTAMPYGTLDLRLVKSPTRYYYLQEGVTFSFRESAPGVKTNTYRDMTSWNSSAYGQGNLREKNGSQDLFVLNYRILLPANYNPDYEPGYPIIMMMHGAGETGNCWNDNCHWSNTSWNPNNNNPPAPTDESSELLNNDRNLFHGGSQHLDAVKLAGTKLPNDPTMPDRAFPGIVIFPQSLNGWLQPSKVEEAIKLLRLIIKKYNVDQNRVYVHGLSNGGAGVNQAIKRAPWLFAAALGMSAVTDGEIAVNNMLDEVSKLPLWYFQGGQDLNPTPSRTFGFVKKLRDAGATVRYYLYPTLGHGTWNTAYKEPDFFTWILSKRKYNPHIYYGYPVICNTTNVGARLGFSKGFLAYQWEKDGAIIEGANASDFVANEPGTYRARFSRTSAAPDESQWEPWSDPIVVSEIEPAKPEIKVTGTTHLRGPGLPSNDANNTIVLTSGVSADIYNWYKNGKLINFTTTDIDDTLSVATFTSGSVSASGAYSLVIKNSNCPSPVSDPVYLFFSNSAPTNLTLSSAAVNFKGTSTTSTVFLSWNDVLSNETGYEIWRRKSGTTDFKFVAKTQKDAVSFLDTALEQATTYQYKFRAINNTGRSNYIPSDNLSINYEITTARDVIYPTAPQSLVVVSNTINSIRISWQKATDDAGLKEYRINYGSSQATVSSSENSFNITGLTVNTVYPITVSAVDFAGHVSQPSNQVIGTTFVTSLIYKHSTGVWTDLDDTTLTKTFVHPEFTGKINNFSLAPRTQEDYFNFQFVGYVFIPQDSIYFFRTTSDDGSRLILDGNIVVDNDGKHGNKTIASDTLKLTAGLHSIEVQYFDNSGNQNLVVQYKGPGISDGLTFINIPDNALKSGDYFPASPPAIPQNPVANPAGLQRIEVTWEFEDDGSTDFEVYRAKTESGLYSIVARVPQTNAIDTVELKPGTTYYYKIKAVNAGGSSDFSVVASAATSADNQAPSVPQSLTLLSKNTSSIAFQWIASTDNVKTTGYEVYANNQLMGTSEVPSFTATELVGNIYTFTVRAFDANGNRSPFSAALVVDNTIPGMYYSLPSGNLNDVSTWKKNADGSGASPSDFTSNGQTFVISNRSAVTLINPWTVSGTNSKVVLTDGIELTIQNKCTCKIELQGSSILNVQYPEPPILASIAPSSTVNFNAVTNIPEYEYGNIILSGLSPKIFMADTTRIFGSLTLSDPVVLNGMTAAPKLKIYGDLMFNSVAEENNIHAIFTDNALHNLRVPDDIRLSKIWVGKNATLNLDAPDTVTVTVGSQTGDGLTISENSVINFGVNNLIVGGSGALNPQEQTGKISIDRGNVTLSSGISSHLYFDPSHNVIKSLQIDMTGAGSVNVHEPVQIEDGIKLTRGNLIANGNITLLANSESSAVIYEIENDAHISGAINVQRIVTNAAWTELSSAVQDMSIVNLQQYIPVTGSFSGASNGEGLSNAPSLLRYREPNGFEAFPPSDGSNTATLQKGMGYQVYVYNQNGMNADSLVYTGNPYQGNVEFTVAGGMGNSIQTGWNLLGNPYASPILWSDNNNWIKNGMSNVIAVKKTWEENGEVLGQYQYFNLALGGGVIEPGQAFWIQATNSGPALTVSEKAKTTRTTIIKETADIRYLNIGVTQNDRTDHAYIFFTSDASDSYQAENDALKRNNEGIFNFSTIAEGNIDLAVNTLNSDFCEKNIQLNLRNAIPGAYEITFENFLSVQDLGSIFLKDNFTGTQKLLDGTPVEFTVTTAPASFGANRFALIISKQILDTEHPSATASDVCPGGNASLVLANSQAGVLYEILNPAGSSISTAKTGDGSALSFTIDNQFLVSGTNTFTIRGGFEGCSAQLFPNPVTLHYTAELAATAETEISTCVNSSTTLHVSGASENGTYHWYGADGTLIENAIDSVYLINSIGAPATYSVSAVDQYGCESDKATIHINTISTTVPAIVQSTDTLFISPEPGYSYQWKRQEDDADLASGAFLVPTDSGEYTVTAINAGCTAESAPFSFKLSGGTGSGSEEGNGSDPGGEVVGIDPDMPHQLMLDVFPVPTRGTNLNVRIQSPNSEKVQVKLIAATGQLFYDKSHQMHEVNHGFDLTPDRTLQNGVYIIIVSQGIHELRKKVIVKN